MAEEKKVAEAVEEAPAKKPAKKATKKAAPKAEKAEAKFAKPTTHDFTVIIDPVITEKTMALMQNSNKVTVRVSANSNKVEIKNAFQRLFQVKVTDVKVINVESKTTTRGGRYQGSIPGFKKAIVTVASGEAIDLFKE
jgi:large subunit ribosomal protein L23